MDDTESLEALVARYLDSKSRGATAEGEATGTYRASAASELTRWVEWMEHRGHDRADLDREGRRIMARYAMHLDRRTRGADGIAASTARTYYAYVSGCLSYAVRDGVLSTNPALADRAREELPRDAESDRTDQQFWSREQRRTLVAHVDEVARHAIDERGLEAGVAVRDRALVRVLAYAAVRGAEVLRHPRDARPGRQGLRWGDVDLDRGVLRVLGKDQQREPALLPGPAREGLDRWQRAQRPADDDWPVFPTDHAPSKYRVGRTELGETFEERLDAVDGDIDALLRDHSLAPPALTTEGARSLMRRLTDDAGVEVGDDAGYLQLHGARRGILEEIYRRDRGDAQDLARHKSLSTTRAAYQHIDAEEKTRRIDDHLGEIE